MPNHVHVVLVPGDEHGLRRAFADTHRRNTAYVNARSRWTGHLWQGRFGAVAMDEDHLANAVRYVSLNPVRARLVERAHDWRWSSVRAHLAGKNDHVVKVAPVLERYGDFAAFLDQPPTRPRGAGCACRRAPGGRAAARPGSQRSRHGRAGPCARRSGGRSRGRRLSREGSN
jgi:hypothetical protein